MNTKILVLVSVLLYLIGIIACIPYLYALPGMTELKTENHLLYVNTKSINTINITTNSLHLDVNQMTIKIIPEKDFVAYITLPDGGNILINTGSSYRAATIKEIITKEITKMGMEYDLMKLFGWEPRIDWLIITSDSPTNTGGLSLFAKSLEIKELITPIRMSFSIPPRVTNTKIVGNKEIDLLQVVSPVKLDITGLTKSRMSKNCLILKLSYLDFSFSFLLDFTPEDQQILFNEYPQFIDATVLFTNFPLREDISTKINPVFIVSRPQDIVFTTDGKSLFVQTAKEIELLLHEIRSGSGPHPK